MRAFEILPFQGAGPVRFGMARADVHTSLGEPLRRLRTRKGRDEDLWDDIKVGYDRDQNVDEIGLAPPALALFQGQDLMRMADPVAFLRSADPAPVEGYGLVLFRVIGIGLTGFDTPGDESDKSIGVYQQGWWTEDDLADFKPLG